MLTYRTSMSRKCMFTFLNLSAICCRTQNYICDKGVEKFCIYWLYLDLSDNLCVFNQMLKQTVQVIGGLLGVPSLFFGLEVNECATKAICISSGPF